MWMYFIFLRTFLQSSFIRLNISFISLSLSHSLPLVLSPHSDHLQSLLGKLHDIACMGRIYISSFLQRSIITRTYTHTHTIIWHWRQIDLDRMNMCFILYFMQPKIKRCCCFFVIHLSLFLAELLVWNHRRNSRKLTHSIHKKPTSKSRIKNPKVESKNNSRKKIRWMSCAI